MAPNTDQHSWSHDHIYWCLNLLKALYRLVLFTKWFSRPFCRCFFTFKRISRFVSSISAMTEIFPRTKVARKTLQHGPFRIFLLWRNSSKFVDMNLLWWRSETEKFARNWKREGAASRGARYLFSTLLFQFFDILAAARFSYVHLNPGIRGNYLSKKSMLQSFSRVEDFFLRF